MKKRMSAIFSRRNVYIALFTILYSLVMLVSLFHSFAFFGLANNRPMSVMLGVCFEIGQVAVLMSLLTTPRERSRIMPWVLMCILTAVQIIGNVFSSYKYMVLHSSEDLRFFKEPIFIWTSIPDNMANVIITYIVGSILPIIALCMTAMISNFLAPAGDGVKVDEEPAVTDTPAASDMPVALGKAPGRGAAPPLVRPESKFLNLR